MKNSSIASPALPDHFVSKDDDGLFEFINNLRLAVIAKVAAEQGRGLPLSEIVIQVRELVRVAAEDAGNARAFPAHAFRTVSRQAVAWCVEAYRPAEFAANSPLTQEKEQQ